MATVEERVEAWVWPPNVLKLAEEKGVAEYLEPLLKMTKEQFPNASRIGVSIDEDWEIENLRTIQFEVEVLGLSPDEYVKACHEHTRKSFEICPSTLICNFGLWLDTH
jgi:hypothetical protein